MLFYQIPIEDYVSGPTSQFDLYARKKDGFFFSVVKNGEAYNPRVITDLSRNGNKYVYVPMADKVRYISFCSKLAKQAIRVPAI